MSKFIIDGDVVSGSTSYASAISCKDADGNDSTVQAELDAQNENFENVIGFPNYSRVLDNTTLKSRGASYTATENCWLIGMLKQDDASMGARVYIDDTFVCTAFAKSDNASTATSDIIVHLPVKKGSIITTRSDSGSYDLTVYAMT